MTKSLADHQRKYLANLLTLRWSSDSSQKIGVALANAEIDLNPHQIDAALFAFRSPLSKGALLADEVGLGKTIEAGLVIAQRWAERRRRILIVVPASLRKQWQQELADKFYLQSVVVDSKSASEASNRGEDLLQSGMIPIISYEYAKTRSDDLAAIEWDIVVFDEAHRLRNVNKPSNVIAKTLLRTFAGCQKLLLTATPLQNSLAELFGLISFIDEHAFGDFASFREQVFDLDDRSSLAAIKDRLMSICHRNLRRQVEPYIRYTRRLPVVQEFTPTPDEEKLYQLVSEYLRQPHSLALGEGSRYLVAMVLRKLLASSTFAIAGALGSLAGRLRAKADDAERRLIEDLGDDFESLPDAIEEWQPAAGDAADLQILRAMASSEARQLEDLAQFAGSIETNAKGEALLQALEIAFERSAFLGAPAKAIIFTESKRTQEYLMGFLASRGYADGLASFNGSNSDRRATDIYRAWRERWQGTDRVTGSRAPDIRAAIIDYFRTEGRILVATEAAAEGINLQFCALVINYDLPWNPQRVEQRIGRCHRYGQRHDVVVVNLLNRGNEADQRVFELLADKFHLFEGVFGASDEVLGALETGVDIERRIADIYQRARTNVEIDDEFDRLQLELTETIDESFARARLQLLENFDDEVREKLRLRERESAAQLGVVDAALMDLTLAELGSGAIQKSPSSFQLLSVPGELTGVHLGLYELPRQSGDGSVYRLEHPLAQHLIRRAKSRQVVEETVEYRYSSHPGKISALEPFVGTSGLLVGALVSVSALDQVEDRLVLAGKTDSGHVLDADLAARLVTLPGGKGSNEAPLGGSGFEELQGLVDDRVAALQREITSRNHSFYQAEAEKLGAWAEDLKAGFEREIKELDGNIREARRQSLAGDTLEEKLAAQKSLRVLERQRARKRKELFESQDQIDVRRDALISQVESKLHQTIDIEPLFSVRWTLS
jgi:superfamily II DNA or RNA helicase